MRFLGLDLTDPYAARPRPVDVALLDENLRCEVVRAPWVRSRRGDWTVDLAALGAGPATDDVLVIDGPLALASAGRGTRECERRLRTPGHTGDVVPVPGSRPFAGFLKASVDLARVLVHDGWRPVLGGVLEEATMLEAYPGSAWPALAGEPLPHKATPAGNAARRELLHRCGVVLPDEPLGHDALDAAICAFLGFLARSRPRRAEAVGVACTTIDGVMREGFIIQPTSGPST